MTDQSLHRCSDRPLVAWLRYLGYSSKSKLDDNGRKVWFYFEKTKQLEEAIDNYLNKRTIEMIPYNFVKEIDSVTDIIYQVKNQNG